MEKVGKPSLLLVEFFIPRFFSGSRADAFPFLSGFLTDREVPVRWVCYSSEEQPDTGDPFIVDLCTPAREQLMREAREVRATHLLFSEKPARELERSIRSELPGVDLRDVAHPEPFTKVFERRWVVHWMDLDGEPEDGYLPDLATPRYDCSLMDATASRRKLPIVLSGGPSCVYSAPLQENPYFKNVDITSAYRRHGCAFCPGHPDHRYPYRTPFVDLTLRQIRAALESEDAVRSKRDFLIRSALALRKLEELFACIQKEGIPPSSFYFSCRVDDLLAVAESMNRVLPLAKKLGHRIHIFSIGAENFSPAENERFNKGISLDQISAAIRLTDGWERSYPDTFVFREDGGLGYILFTPWTRLDDLKINLEVAQQLGIEDQGFFLTRRLMLLSRSAIYHLARRDGLLAEEDEEALKHFRWLEEHCDPGCRTWYDEKDIPWRFADPLVAAICAITVRMSGPRKIVEDDPYQERILQTIRDTGHEDDLFHLFGLLLKVAEEHEGPPTVKALIEAFLSSLELEAAAEQVIEDRDESVVSSLTDTYFQTFDRLADHPAGVMRGFRLAEVNIYRDRTRLRLTFRRGEEELVLIVAPASAVGSSYLKRGNLAFSHDPSTSLDTRDRRALLELVVRVFVGRDYGRSAGQR